MLWTFDGDGFWDVGSNWSTGVAPSNGQEVIIDRPGQDITVTIRNGNHNISTLSSEEKLVITGGNLSLTLESNIHGGLELNSGVLTVNSELELDGESTWIGGTLNGAGVITNNGNWTWSGGTKALTSVTLTNNESINHLQGQVQLRSSTINNLSGAEYQFSAEGDFLEQWGGSTSFNNAGSFRKVGGAGVSRINNTAFNNHGGTVEAQTGILSLNGGGLITGGNYFAGSGAIVRLTDGSTHTWIGTFTGSGSQGRL